MAEGAWGSCCATSESGGAHLYRHLSAAVSCVENVDTEIITGAVSLTATQSVIIHINAYGRNLDLAVDVAFAGLLFRDLTVLPDSELFIDEPFAHILWHGGAVIAVDVLPGAGTYIYSLRGTNTDGDGEISYCTMHIMTVENAALAVI